MKVIALGDITLETQYLNRNHKIQKIGATGNIVDSLKYSPYIDELILYINHCDSEAYERHFDGTIVDLKHHGTSMFTHYRDYLLYENQTGTEVIKEDILTLQNNKTDDPIELDADIYIIEQHFDENNILIEKFFLDVLPNLRSKTNSKIFVDFRNLEVILRLMTKLKNKDEALFYHILKKHSFYFKCNQNIKNPEVLIKFLDEYHYNFWIIQTHQDNKAFVYSKVQGILEKNEYKIDDCFRGYNLRCTIGCGDIFFAHFISSFVKKFNTYSIKESTIKKSLMAGRLSSLLPGVNNFLIP